MSTTDPAVIPPTPLAPHLPNILEHVMQALTSGGAYVDDDGLILVADKAQGSAVLCTLYRENPADPAHDVEVGRIALHVIEVTA